MRYTIEFLYVDNDQLFHTDVELTPDELGRVSKFLTALERVGDIKREGGGDPMIWEYR